MKYIIKNMDTGQYLYSGRVFFEWTPDIYYARVFKGIKGATNTLNQIRTKANCKILGIEMKEIEL